MVSGQLAYEQTRLRLLVNLPMWANLITIVGELVVPHSCVKCVIPRSFIHCLATRAVKDELNTYAMQLIPHSFIQYRA